MIAIPLIIQTFFIIGITYFACRPLGIVYETDAQAEDDVTVIARFPAESHPPIRYPVAALTPVNNPAVTAFLDFLDTPQAQDIFTKAGFTRPVE